MYRLALPNQKDHHLQNKNLMLPNKEMYPFEKNNSNKLMQKLSKISFLKHPFWYLSLLFKVKERKKDTSELIDFLKQLLNIIFYLLDLP